MKPKPKGQDKMLPSDTDLIRRAQAGDAMAFEQLVHRYDRQVFSLAANYVNNAEDAKDIYQEVFLRVYRSLPRFELRSEFSTWLFRITTNVCVTHRTKRRKHGHRSLTDDDEGQDGVGHGGALMSEPAERPDRRAIGEEISESVARAMESLSPRLRMAFTLRHIEGYRLQEIAATMDCSVGTVKRYLFTATRKMRRLLKVVHE